MTFILMVIRLYRHNGEKMRIRQYNNNSIIIIIIRYVSISYSIKRHVQDTRADVVELQL